MTFTGGGITPDTETLNDGVATFSTSALPLGSDTVTATYSGDSTYAVSSGQAPVTITTVGTATTDITPALAQSRDRRSNR